MRKVKRPLPVETKTPRIARGVLILKCKRAGLRRLLRLAILARELIGVAHCVAAAVARASRVSVACACAGPSATSVRPGCTVGAAVVAGARRRATISAARAATCARRAAGAPRSSRAGCKSKSWKNDQCNRSEKFGLHGVSPSFMAHGQRATGRGCSSIEADRSPRKSTAFDTAIADSARRANALLGRIAS
jgi:hypothetical protein